MKFNEERNLILRVIRYALEKETFTYGDLIQDLELSGDENGYVHSTCISHKLGDNNPNHIITISKVVYQPKQQTVITSGSMIVGTEPVINYTDSSYKLLPTALFSYVDYVEIKEARRSSKLAFWLSIAAIILSTVVGGVQIYFQLYPIGN